MILWINAFVVFCMGILTWLFTINYNRKKVPPGPMKIPIFGNILQILLADELLGPAYYKLSKRYGKIMNIKQGSDDAIILSSHETVRELYARDDLTDRYFDGPSSDRNMNKNMGIIFSSGDVWRNLRRFTIRTLRDFGFARSLNMETAQQEELQHFIEFLREKVKKSENGVIPMHGIFALTTLNVIWSLIMGERFPYDDPKSNRYMELNDQFFSSQSFVSGWSLLFPFLRDWFPDKTGRSDVLNSVAELQAFLRTIIKERRDTKIYQSDPENFVDVFLSKIDAEFGNSETVFTDDQLLIVLLDIFQAGGETTSSTLNFTILFLILYPHVQQKLRDEVLEHIPKGSLPCLEHKSKMVYMQATILEAHRLSVIIPVPISHKVVTDFTYNGFYFKAGTPVYANMYALFMDTDIWGDSEVFRPERFINKEGIIDKDLESRIIPFLIGKRICLGMSVAETSIFMYLTALVQNFTFSTVKGEPIPSTHPRVGFTYSPQPYNVSMKIRD